MHDDDDVTLDGLPEDDAGTFDDLVERVEALENRLDAIEDDLRKVPWTVATGIIVAVIVWWSTRS